MNENSIKINILSPLHTLVPVPNRLCLWARNIHVCLQTEWCDKMLMILDRLLHIIHYVIVIRPAFLSFSPSTSVILTNGTVNSIQCADNKKSTLANYEMKPSRMRSIHASSDGTPHSTLLSCPNLSTKQKPLTTHR